MYIDEKKKNANFRITSKIKYKLRIDFQLFQNCVYVLSKKNYLEFKGFLIFFNWSKTDEAFVI